MNAILNYRGSKKDLENSKIYVDLFPCNECAKAIIQAGIKCVVYKENKGIVIAKKTVYPNETYRFSDGFFEIGGFELQVQRVQYQDCLTKNDSQFDLEKALFIAVDKTEELVVRLRNSGDTIQKFGGGSKSLGDFLTDKKVPLRLRDRLPVFIKKRVFPFFLLLQTEMRLFVFAVWISHEVQKWKKTAK